MILPFYLLPESRDRPLLRAPRCVYALIAANVAIYLATALAGDLVLAMLPTWGYYVNDVRSFDAQSALEYGRWLGARYREAPNVVWVNGGDWMALTEEPMGRSGQESRHTCPHGGR